MKDELFTELITSICEGGKILRGKKKSSRTIIVERLNIKRTTRTMNVHKRNGRKPNKSHRD